MELSKEYGTALFHLACEEKSQDDYGKALEIIATQMLENPEFLELLSCPSVPMSERINVIEQTFGSGCPEYVVSFVKILCEKGHIKGIGECAEEYSKLLDASKQISVARVTSAIELSQEQKEQLIQKLEKKNGHSVILECHTDKSLIGGMIIEMDGKIIDGSLRNRLEEVKDVISR